VQLSDRLAFKAATYTLADQLNQILQLALVRCFDTLKTGRPVVAIHIDAIQKQDVEMYVEVQGGTETLD